MLRLTRFIILGIFLATSLNLNAQETESTESPVVADTSSSSVMDLISSEGKVLFGDEPNSLLVIDYPENINRIDQYLKMVDVPPRQVHIEARVAEVKLEGEHALGVQWSLFADTGSLYGKPFSFFSTSRGGGVNQGIDYKSTGWPPTASTQTAETPFTLTIFNKNINLVLKTLANELDTNILSAPSITTVNNREAEIKIIEKIAWAEPEVTTVGESSTSTQVTWTINYEEVGIILRVTPTISEDGKISMILEPEISENNSDLTLTIQSGSDTFTYTVPNVDTRTANTKVVVGNGQTIIIGGLIKNKVSHAETKIPFLGDIPYLGNLFKSNLDTVKKQEILIFVSPTIIDDRQINHMVDMKETIKDKMEGPAALPKKRFKAVLPVAQRLKETEEVINERLKKAQDKAQSALEAKDRELIQAQKQAEATYEAKEEALQEAQRAARRAILAKERAIQEAKEETKRILEAKGNELKKAEEAAAKALKAKEQAFREAEKAVKQAQAAQEAAELKLEAKEESLLEVKADLKHAQEAKGEVPLELDDLTQEVFRKKEKELILAKQKLKLALQAKEQAFQEVEEIQSKASKVKEESQEAVEERIKKAVLAQGKEAENVRRKSEQELRVKEKALLKAKETVRKALAAKDGAFNKVKELKKIQKETKSLLKAKEKELRQIETSTQKALEAKEKELEKVKKTANSAINAKEKAFKHIKEITQKAIEAREKELFAAEEEKLRRIQAEAKETFQAKEKANAELAAKVKDKENAVIQAKEEELQRIKLEFQEALRAKEKEVQEVKLKAKLAIEAKEKELLETEIAARKALESIEQGLVEAERAARGVVQEQVPRSQTQVEEKKPALVKEKKTPQVIEETEPLNQEEFDRLFRIHEKLEQLEPSL